MGTEKKRLQIINELKNTFLKAGTNGLIKSSLNAQICLRHGVTKLKADEYINVLLEGKFIKEDLGELWLDDKFIENI